jgi:hypothetical protein
MRPPNRGNWFSLPNQMVDVHARQIGAAALAVYAVLRRHADAAGVAWPSLSRVARTLGVDRRHVIRLVKQLERAGLVEVVRDSTKTNRYRFPDLSPADGADAGASRNGASHAPATPPQLVTPMSPPSDTHVTSLVTPMSPALVTPMSPKEDQEKKTKEKDQGKKTPPTPPRGGRGGATPSLSHDQEEAFERFWQAYRKKTKKAEAREAWRELDPAPELAEEIIRAARRQSGWKCLERDRGQYIPAPAKWLRTERWTDEPASNEDRADGYLAELGKELGQLSAVEEGHHRRLRSTGRMLSPKEVSTLETNQRKEEEQRRQFEERDKANKEEARKAAEKREQEWQQELEQERRKRIESQQLWNKLRDGRK